MHLAAHVVDPLALRMGDFTDFAQWISSGANEDARITLQPSGSGPLSAGDLTHFGSVWSTDDGGVFGVVRLFGSICYGGQLASDYSGKRFHFVGQCDSIAGQENFEEGALRDDVLEAKSFEQERFLIKEQMNTLMMRVMNAHFERVRSEKLNELLAELFADFEAQGIEYLGEDQINVIASRVARLHINLLYGGTASTPLTGEQIVAMIRRGALLRKTGEWPNGE